MEAAGAFAAYVTGNVASNLVGRLMAAAVADHFGLAANFLMFAALNLAGAVLVYFSLGKAAADAGDGGTWRPRHSPPGARISATCRCAAASASASASCSPSSAPSPTSNFVLTRPPLLARHDALGLVYFVFVPSIVTTPLAGHAVGSAFGTRPAIWLALAIAAAGLPLLVLPQPAGRARRPRAGRRRHLLRPGHRHRLRRPRRDGAIAAPASGIYLASYFCRRPRRQRVLGQVFDRLGWPACVAGVGSALAVAGLLATRLKLA